MTATSADIARFTNDGVVLTATRADIKTLDPNADDAGTTERVLFFDDVAGGQFILDEAFSLQSQVGRPHEGLALADTLGLGSVVPIWPNAPGADIYDISRGIEARTALRAYSFDMGSDSYAIELVGLAGMPGVSVTVDTTKITIDNNVVRVDSNYRSVPEAPR